MRPVLFLWLTLVLAKTSFAQQNIADSLETELKNARTDSVRLDLLNQLCFFYTNSSIDKAKDYCERAVKLNSMLPLSKLKAESYYNLGLYHNNKGNYSLALKNHLMSLGIREELGDSVEMARSYGNIGLVYYAQKNYPLALKYHESSLRIKQIMKNEKGMAYSYNNIGMVYEGQKQYEASISYYNRAREIFEKLKNEDGMSMVYNNLGIIYNHMKNYPMALKYNEASLKLSERMGDQRGVIYSYHNIGNIYLRQSNFSKASEYLKKALDEARKTEDKESVLYALHSLSEMYEAMGEPAKSLSLFKLFAQMKDSLLNAESSKQVAEMQVRFDTEKKQKEIELLTREKRIKETEVAHQTLLRNSFVGGFALVLVLSFVLYNRYQIKNKANLLLASQKVEIEHQKSIVEEQNRDIKDSIRYAKRIQEALLPAAKFKEIFRETAFILYQPKDIVSGDFYWVEAKKEMILLAVADCTGHGVPGAFMSIVGHNLLNQAVNEHGKTDPAEILSELDEGVLNTLGQTSEESTIKDGMDIALCRIDPNTNELLFSGANNPLYLVRNGMLNQIKADKHPVGAYLDRQAKSYTCHKLQLEKGDMMYVFSDGYADQFGGAEGKKFKYSRLKELLISISDKPMEVQKSILHETIELWKGTLEQVDDICIAGVRIS